MLFCDLSGSTAMGERMDAESVRELMFSYFHEMRGAIERHGGTVEKFIGDAVVAVFGVPLAHEDDALRAVRAAWEMQQRVGRLNEELEGRFGSRIALRIGVNTGEVVAGDASSRQALVTGDAVNVAARLEQAAAPGEILIGEPTYRLVRDAVSADPVSPLQLKGKSKPLPAFRLEHVEETAPARARRLDTPIVGRRPELAVLQRKLAEAARGRCLLATVVGEPGVGKSRLAAELIASAQADFQVFSGRCLQYGEGITYWPIAEIVRQAAGIHDEHSREEAVSRIESLLPSDQAQVVAQAIGLVQGQASTQEIAAATHALLGRLAGRRPLVLFVDDIHWAEPALLALLVGLPAEIGDAPLLLLCLARPELLDGEPQWDVAVHLQPLEAADGATLVAQLLGDAELPEGIADRISAAAAGNPLFVEELVGMLIDDGLLERRNGAWTAGATLAEFTIPPTLRELLGARLDRLPSGDRAALERGAVEGQVFHRGAVVELSNAEQRLHVPECLQALLAREYIRPARADFVEESAFRVRHILIRDAAYEGIPKKLRASLHERFAEWLEQRAGERVGEFEEILGYHLEQAYHYREQLGPVDARSRELALRAAEWLERAGRRALDRRDSPATVSLLSRATELLPDESETRLDLLQLVGEELGFMMDLDRAGEAFRQVHEAARAHGNRRLEAHARIWRELMKFFADPDFGVVEMLAALDEVEAVFRELEQDRGIARTHDWRAFVYSHMGRFSDSEDEAEKAIELFRRNGDRRLTVEQFWYLGWAAAFGPKSVAEGIARCRRIFDEAGDDAGVEGHTLYSLAVLESLRGRFAEAKELAERGFFVFERTGMAFTVWYLLHRGAIELLAGNTEDAERDLREACAGLEKMFDFPSLTNATSLLAEVLVEQGRVDEASELTARAREWAPKDQPPQHARWRAAQARVLARQGDPGAEALAQQAIELAARTDFLVLQGDCLLALADVRRVAGDSAEGGRALEHALDAYRQKGATALVARARRLLPGISSTR